MENYYLVIDLEATCWERGDHRVNKMEIIEIGAVLYDAEKDQIINEFQTFVKPVRNPILSDFCTQLTSITQKQVDSAPLFPEAVESLKKEILDHYPVLFCSWGSYDKKQFEKDCEFNNILYPFTNHLNLKALFAESFHQKKTGLSSAIQKLGMQFEGSHHRGIDDARNIVRILQVLKPFL